MAAFKVVRNQRVVRRLQSELHGQVQRGRRFAAAAHPHQNHVRQLQVVVRLAVVVLQREVDGFDPVVVLLALGNVRKAPHAVVGLHAQFVLQRRNERAEHVNQHALALCPQHGQHFHVDHGGEDQRAHAVHLGGMVDLANRLEGLVGVVHEGQAHALGVDLELRQDGLGKRFGGDAGAIGNEEGGAVGHGVGGQGPTITPIIQICRLASGTSHNRTTIGVVVAGWLPVF